MTTDSIRNDPFARFERSRGGFLIPIALFIIGALITVWAAHTLTRLNQVDQQAKLKAQAVQIQEEQRAKALQELKALILHMQSLSPEEQQEFLKNNPQIKIVRQPETPPTEPPTPETQQLETNQP
ncbi:hypothetical protein LF1_01490 [Rubripirellula obstinata]|uniref:Cell division protein FtsL n=1 Tax=Rubripirellula obstinata TaxID=406547 RepID=A0A5B1CBQ0_9BACT|nr:hypothetical protein [Rubripirellula obstinata]KAA1257661.1 hypothetical protein LF1_01490 [Rubripirellula obstinata]